MGACELESSDVALRRSRLGRDQGWLYLAAVMVLYSRKIVGWAICDHLRAELPLAVLVMAISVQRPDEEPGGVGWKDVNLGRLGLLALSSCKADRDFRRPACLTQIAGPAKPDLPTSKD